MRFVVFLCYSVRYLYVIQCSFAVFAPPLSPPHQMATNDMKMQGWNWDKIMTILNTKVKYLQLHGPDLLNKQNDCFWNSDGELYPHPPPQGDLAHHRKLWGETQEYSKEGAGGDWRGSKLQHIATVSNHYFHPFELERYIFLFCVAKFITDEMQIWKRILHILQKFQTIRSFTVSHLFLLCSF